MKRTMTAVALTALALLWIGPPATAYIEAAYPLGRIILESTNICVMQVDKVDKENNRILYKKIRDVKGVHPTDVLVHNIAKAGFHPREWQTVMAWAEPGKMAMFFYNGGASETAIDTYWYQCYGGGRDWGMSHGEPFLLRSYAGKVEKLAMAVEEILANREVIVPAMQDGDKNLLHVRQAKVQRLRASLKLQDYNANRDFIGWGSEDFRRIVGMAGFTHMAHLARVDPEAKGIAPADFDGDGATDLLIYGEKKVVLVKVDGGALNEIALPYAGGARSASWADFNGDGRPDLLLGTPEGPKLLTNTPKNFRDESALLPKESYYNVTAAAWIDYDGDGKPDVLLANGFLGLRLYKNPGAPAPVAPKVPKYGPWYFIGGFASPDNNNFDAVFPPEKEIKLDAKYPTRVPNVQVSWQKKEWPDGTVYDFLSSLPAGLQENIASYVYREIDCETAAEVPVSLGSDDTLTVWLNGQKLHSENVGRGAAPDQAFVKLPLKKGKNALLMKICNGGGPTGYYFLAKEAEIAGPAGTPFIDVSDKLGLGPDGLASREKGDHLLVADFNGDGRPDILYSAGTGIFLRNTPNGFTEDRGSVKYKAGGVTPAAADMDGDGKIDLFIPQADGGKLYRNDGNWKFTDITAESGDLAKFTGHATSAAWVDFGKKGKPDLLIGCMGGANRLFRNLGGGKFKDATAEVGLDRKVLNSRGVAFGDVNKDGALDIIFNNEGQDPFILLGEASK
jgi:FG-GAP-like repeat